jgi:pyridoxal 5'-phosphate synthase pdxT subunit
MMNDESTSAPNTNGDAPTTDAAIHHSSFRTHHLGDFAEHAAILRRLGVEPREVRLPRDLEGLDGLIIPGGESTTITRLLQIYDLLEPLRERVRGGLPTWGTCAGAIVLAREAVGLDQPNIGAMDLVVRRNAFGRQVDSFETDLGIAPLGEELYRAVFIRAPTIEGIGPNVQVLARLADGTAVAAREGTMLASSFHPELTDDPRFHQYFVDLIRQAKD